MKNNFLMILMKKFNLLTIIALLLLLLPTACQEKESDLGANLQDPFTIYNGTRDTVYLNACTVFDDSLLTMNQNFSIVGHHSDEVFGSVEAQLYCQMALSSATGLAVDSMTFDSVVLGLVVDKWYPSLHDSNATMRLHFMVERLAAPFGDSTIYYSTDDIAVGTSANDIYFDSTITCSGKDSIIYLHLHTARIREIFANTTSDAEFRSAARGLRIRLINDADAKMISFNMAATATKVTSYYRYGINATAGSLDFVIGTTATATAKRFTRFIHQRSADMQRLAEGLDSLPGNDLLYLSPMGGTMIKFDLQQWIDAFRMAHPTAIIHYAELIAPVAEQADDEPPARLLAYKTAQNGFRASIPDLLDAHTYSGFDGHYNKTKGHYRMRVTQHLQQLLRTGEDYGSLIVIDGRLSTANRTIINGCDNTTHAGKVDNLPIRIDFIYSE